MRCFQPCRDKHIAMSHTGTIVNTCDAGTYLRLDHSINKRYFQTVPHERITLEWIQGDLPVVVSISFHDDVIKWKHFRRYWPFVRGIHRSPVNSPHKGQWRGALMFSLICTQINGNNGDTGDLRHHRAHYDATVMCHGNSTRGTEDLIPIGSFQGVGSVQICHLTSTGNLIVEIRRSYDRLISTMGLPILVRWHIHIESGPSFGFRYRLFFKIIIQTGGALACKTRFTVVCSYHPKNK